MGRPPPANFFSNFLHLFGRLFILMLFLILNAHMCMKCMCEMLYVHTIQYHRNGTEKRKSNNNNNEADVHCTLYTQKIVSNIFRNININTRLVYVSYGLWVLRCLPANQLTNQPTISRIEQYWTDATLILNLSLSCLVKESNQQQTLLEIN